MIPAALTTAFTMPLIGKALQKGVPQQYLVAAGMLLFFGFTYWGFKILTPETAADNFFWMLILRGLGMGMLFIPITTLSLSTLKGQQIGQGASFTGMMRQLGGSFGIASITTFMARQNMVHFNDIDTHLNVNALNVQQKVSVMKHGFMLKGMTPDIALKSTYKALEGSVMKQAAILSYMDVFLYLGIMFLICVPFVLFVKGHKLPKMELAEAMH